MSTRRCAIPTSDHPANRQIYSVCFSHGGCPVRFFLISLFVLLLLLPVLAEADETIVASISLDQVAKGDFFVLLTADGDFLLKVDDLKSMGFQHPFGDRHQVQNEEYLSLRSMDGVSFDFNEDNLILEIHADPSLLPTSELDLKPGRREGVYTPRDNSLFLNYGLDYSAGGEELDYHGISLANELGIRYRNLLFLSNTQYTDTPEGRTFLRYMTSLTYDHRDRLQRLVVGDFFASSGELGSRLNMGGVSFSKVYRIDPYFIRYPLFDFSGLISQPSQIELLVDGLRVRSERFAPGEFALRNFQGIGGAQTVEIIIRDALGRERRIASPYYFTDQLLRQGLHEYSYNLGFLRRDFGQESNRYSDLVVTGFHRYGVSDQLNLGVQGGFGDGVMNLGAEAAWTLGALGLLRVEAAGSSAREATGWAGFLSYEYLNRRFRSRLAMQGFSEDYRNVDEMTDASRRKYNLLAGIGYSTPEIGSLALDFARSSYYAAEADRDRETVSLSWSRRLKPRVYANVSLRRIQEEQDTDLVEVTLTWYFGDDISVSAAVSRDDDGNRQVLEARKNTPLGQGTGWDVRAERSEGGTGESYLANTLVQHNARHAIVRGDVSLGSSENLTTEDVRLSLSGALVAVGNTFALTRPVNDSFALVSVGEAEGVGVSINGQLSGYTDNQGKMIVTELSSYYENQVSIEDKDIPLDYLMPRIRLFLSPPLRSGSCLNFPLHRYQAFTGNLVVDNEAGRTQLADAEISLNAPAGPVVFWTGQNGEFYLDTQQVEFDPLTHQGCGALPELSRPLLPPGEYPLLIRQGEITFRSRLSLPDVAEQFAELGEIVLPALARPVPAGPVEQ